MGKNGQSAPPWGQKKKSAPPLEEVVSTCLSEPKENPASFLWIALKSVCTWKWVIIMSQNRHVDTTPSRGRCGFLLCPSEGGRIDHFRQFLPIFASFFKYFNAKIAPRGGGRLHLSPPPPYLLPCLRGKGVSRLILLAVPFAMPKPLSHRANACANMRLSE